MIKRACVAMVALAVCFGAPAMAEDEEDKLDHFVFRGFFSWLTSSGEQTSVGTTIPVDPPGATFPQGSACLLDQDCFGVVTGDGTGFQANFEFRATELVGIEIGGLTGGVDGRVIGNILFGVDDDDNLIPGVEPSDCNPFGTNCLLFNQGGPFDEQMDVDMFYVGVNFHVWKKQSSLDVYVGPFYTAMKYGDGSITIPARPEDSPPQEQFLPPFNLLYDVEDDDTWGLNGGFDVRLGKHWLVGGSLRYVSTAPNMSIVNVDTGNSVRGFEVKINPFIFSVGGGVRF